ncbi:unnamed protein product [Effrenium voratum]|nr:unnamed protein product [Effrenium voratum]
MSGSRRLAQEIAAAPSSSAALAILRRAKKINQIHVTACLHRVALKPVDSRQLEVLLEQLQVEQLDAEALAINAWSLAKLWQESRKAPMCGRSAEIDRSSVQTVTRFRHFSKPVLVFCTSCLPFLFRPLARQAPSFGRACGTAQHSAGLKFQRGTSRICCGLLQPAGTEQRRQS